MKPAIRQPGRTKPYRLRAIGLAALAACFGAAALGLSFPVLSLEIERATGSGQAIGLHAGAAALSTIAIAPFVPKLLKTFGMRTLFTAAGLLAGTCFFLLGAIKDTTVWLGLRFLLGVFTTVFFIGPEIWVNAVTRRSWRGRALSLFAASISLGLALGATLAGVLEATALSPYPFGVALCLAPVLTIWWPAPRPRRSEATLAGIGEQLRMARLAPAALIGAASFGMFETGMLNFLPVWAVRAEFSAPEGAGLLAAIGFGNVLLLPIIGWCADRFGATRMLIFCAFTAALAPLSLVALAPQFAPSLLGAFILGGMVTGLYSVGLFVLVQRVSSRQMPSANAAYVSAYGLGSLIAPPVAGWALSQYSPHGVMFAFAMMGVLVLSGIALFERRAIIRA
jgi:MFS family permease